MLFRSLDGEQARVRGLVYADELRDAIPGIRLQVNCGGGSFKSQMRKADASGARVAVIVGDDECDAGVVSLKLLREAAQQVRVSVEEAIDLIKKGANRES